MDFGVRRLVTAFGCESSQTTGGDKESTVSGFFNPFLAIILALGLAGCGVRLSSNHSLAAGRNGSLTLEEKHRLYSAALAASDTPLDTGIFKDVCRKIGIFDENGNPNPTYMTFVQQHVQWSMTAETNQFRSEINTKEKAHEYVLKHLP